VSLLLWRSWREATDEVPLPAVVFSPMITSAYAPAKITVALISAALLAGLLPILWLASENSAKLFDAYILRVLTFTLWQSLLSTLLSLLLGIPAALALARRQFPGRNMIVSLLALPLALPQIVVVLTLVGLFGENGWLNGTIPLYGLSGILLAHVFFNATLAARLSLQALQSIPTEQLRLAGQLGLSDWRHIKLVDWPTLKQVLPGIALLIFLLCAASFTIVLTLGSGPQTTTLEAAIYQSLRSDFDPARAASLSLIQLVLCLGLGLAILRAGVSPTQATLRLTAKRFDGVTVLARISDVLAIAVLALLLLLPLITLLTKGLPNLTITATTLKATLTSVIFATATSVVATVAAYALAHAAVRNKSWSTLAQLASFMGLAVPPAVIATGWFLIAVNTTGLSHIAPVLIIALNALLSLPYVFGLLLPAMRSVAQQDRLAASLKLSGWNRFWTVDRKALSPALIASLAMSTALSMGDLAAILFFGDGRYITLPSLIYQQMGSYRMQGAMGTALVLAALVWLILMAAEKAGKRA
jgi:thiamine transport system permease protein